MAEMIAQLMYWGYLVNFFMVSFIGMCLLVCGLLRCGRRVIDRFFEVAVLVEAIREARKQGRAPILRAWIRFSGDGQNK